MTWPCKTEANLERVNKSQPKVVIKKGMDF